MTRRELANSQTRDRRAPVFKGGHFMKHWIILSALAALTSTQAFAANCEPKAKDLVRKLETAYTELEGVVQGDFDADDEGQLKAVKTATDATTVTYRVEALHTNEDDEMWVNFYRVTLAKNSCLITRYSFAGAIED